MTLIRCFFKLLLSAEVIRTYASNFAVVCSVLSGEDRGRYHYTSEGRHIRIFVQLLSSVEESDLDLPTYFSTNGAFIVKYEGIHYVIFYL